jgi:hypothetical protein
MNVNKTQLGVLIAALVAAAAAAMPTLAPVLPSKVAVWVLAITNILSAVLGKVQGEKPPQ